MLEIAIIADDLTGAADTGVQFCPYFNGTLLTAYQNLSSAPSGAFHFDAQALAVFTNSRAIDAESARERVQSVARHLVRLRPGHIYKKVDSCIRGNIGVEVETVMDEMGYDLSFTAPAFPEMGRTTLHDVHLVDGTPVARTELSRDPVTPVTESRLSRTMALQCRYPVGHVDLKYLDGVDEVLSGEIDSLVHLGARHLVFDATKQTHLDRIAHFALDSPEKVLLVGSAGLAESLGRHFPKRPLVEENELKPIPEGNHLLICGTTSEHTRLQISTVIDRYPYEVIPLEPDLLADPTRREELFLKSRFAQSVLSRNNSIITIRAPKPHSWTAGQIVDGLGIFAASVLKSQRPASLFLTGGDTANAVLNSIGAMGIRLFGEIVPGIVRGAVLGGLCDGLPVVTKAGAFGRKDALVALHDYWRGC